ncbi:MAG: hypothetical protein ACXWPM_08185 [Bdellovibrionota bacterium]
MNRLNTRLVIITSAALTFAVLGTGVKATLGPKGRNVAIEARRKHMSVQQSRAPSSPAQSAGSSSYGSPGSGTPASSYAEPQSNSTYSSGRR